jgi:hypothetical protein
VPGEERVFRNHLLVAANGLLLIEDASARWHTALERVERAAIARSSTRSATLMTREKVGEEERLIDMEERGGSSPEGLPSLSRQGALSRGGGN